jgi:tetratricopeptide (TPR) repeat protein
LLAGLVLAVLLVYQPAWRGGFVWDDHRHVPRPELRSWYGLYCIWYHLGATQQYYPLLHSVFWVEYRLWGDATLGYHLVNILLHAAAVVLVALVLRRLCVPGAYLAAAIFALHPVHVESVAWITEQKNTLSAVFYLAAMLVYLRFDRQRKYLWYFGALALFVLGLLSKTTAATLPAALLVIFWWQRGRLSWRRDVLPLVPFFVLGLMAGLFTAWVERKLIGAEGAAFELTIVERCLLAGRAIWFYLGKLFWPTELIFIYPRWQVSQTVWWQYLFPLAALLLLAGCWVLRRRWRGPLAGLLFFVGTLLPALGFCNVFPFLYSFVADHFQYLASLGVITLVAAGASMLLRRWGLWNHPVGYAACLTLLVSLGVLTWRQSRMYGDVESLYLATIARNPDCWMAHNNLAVALADRGRLDEATAHYQQAVKIKPDFAEGHYNLGVVLLRQGRLDEAMARYRKVLEIKPDDAGAHYSLGNALANRGRLAEAMAQYRKSLEIKPDHVEALNNLAAAFARLGRLDEAIAHYQKAVEIKPDYIRAHYNLGGVLAARGRFDEAVAHYRTALELATQYNNRALADAAREKISQFEAGNPRPQPPSTSLRPPKP